MILSENTDMQNSFKTIVCAMERHRFLNFLLICHDIHFKRKCILYLDKTLCELYEEWGNVRKVVIDSKQWFPFAIFADLYIRFVNVLKIIRSNSGYIAFSIIDIIQQIIGEFQNETCLTSIQGNIKTLLSITY